MPLDRRSFLGLAAAGLLGCDREGALAGKDASASTWRTAIEPARAAGRTPVIVELFSSEGCSSCPPADAVLADLVATQPVDDVLIVGLELHVDYWDDLGWKDPFSSREFTARQRRYAAQRGTTGVFTPEAVVGGVSSVLGSSREDVLAAVRAARARSSIRVSLTAHAGREVEVSLDAGAESASLMVAIIEHGLSSRPTRGENAGRQLVHAPVVRFVHALEDRFYGRSRRITIPGPGSRGGDGQQAVVFLQARDDLAIVGAAAIALTA